MPKFSANLGFLWTDRPLLERIEAAASAGFKAVELHWPYDTPAQSVRDACAANGLTLLGLNTAIGNPDAGEFGLGAVAGREQAFQDAVDQSRDYARIAGASAIHLMAGVVPAERRPEAREVLVRNLAVAADKIPDRMLLLEPINARDKPGYFYSTVEEAASIIEDVGAPNLKVMFDVYHIGISQGDIFKRLERYLPIIGHVQIAAVPSRAEPDEGEIAYAEVFRELDRLGYRGWVGCEYRPRGDTGDGLRWVSALGLSL